MGKVKTIFRFFKSSILMFLLFLLQIACLSVNINEFLIQRNTPTYGTVFENMLIVEIGTIICLCFFIKRLLEDIDTYRDDMCKRRIASIADGTQSTADLNNLVDYWRSHSTYCSVQEFYRLTNEENEIWVKESDNILKKIFNNRRTGSA